MANSTASRCRHGPLPSNHFRLEETDHGFGERIVIRIAAAADRRRDAGVGQAFGVAHRHVLGAAIAVMDQAVGRVVAAVVDRLVEGIEDEICPQRAGHPPPDDAARKDVDDERDVDKAAPRRDVREVGDPELIRPRRREVPIDEIDAADRPPSRTASSSIHARPRDRAGEPHRPHQPTDAAARRAQMLAPHLLATPCAARRPDGVSSQMRRMIARSTSSRCARAERRVGSRRSACARKYVDGAIGNTRQIGSTPYARDASSMKRHHHFGRRSSSAWAKNADAFRRISFARFSSKFSRSSCFNRWRSSVVRPGRWPASRSAWRTQRRNASTVQPSLLGD